MIRWHLPACDTYFAPILEQTPQGFEVDHLEEALKHVKKFDFAIDGGAHVGTWTEMLCERFKSVWAFEPAPDTFECLQHNTFGRKNLIRFNAALGANNGRCSVKEDPTRIGNTGSRIVSASQDGAGTMTALDTFKLETLDFLKLDVEGFEIFALTGAYETIQRCKPTLMVECKEFKPVRHGGVTVVKCMLEQMGYVEVGGIRNDRVFVPA